MKGLQKFIKKNGSTILTVVGAVGVVATAVAAGKGAVKASKRIEQVEEIKGEELTIGEKVQVSATAFIPAVAIGAGTVTCIFGANILNKRQQAAITSAYALVHQSYKDFKRKTIEMYGENAVNEVRNELIKEQYEQEETLEEDDGKNLFFDDYSNRYYRATNETVLRASYELNRLIQEEGGASLNQYYGLLGIDPVEYGDEVGWEAGILFDMYWTDWVDVVADKVEMEDGMECFRITLTEPVFGYIEGP